MDVTRREYAQALLELIDEQIPIADWGRTDPQRLATATVGAVEVLTVTSRTHLIGVAGLFRVLNPAGDHTPLHRTVKHSRGSSPVLVSLMLASVAPGLGLQDRLMFRTVLDRPQTPGGDAALAPGQPQPRGAWPARGWVSPMLWDGFLPACLEGRGRFAPAAASLALSKIGSSAPMRAIAVDLGLPGWLADRVKRIFGRHGQDDLDRLVSELEQLFEHLSAYPPPVDYSQRVLHARDLTMISNAVQQAADAQGYPSSATREDLQVLLWATYTASHPDFYPGPRTEILPDSQPARMPSWPDGLDVQDFLADAFERLPHAHLEPLTWQPP